MVLKTMYSIIYPSVLSLYVSVRPIPLEVTLQPALNTLIISTLKTTAAFENLQNSFTEMALKIMPNINTLPLCYKISRYRPIPFAGFGSNNDLIILNYSAVEVYCFYV